MTDPFEPPVYDPHQAPPPYQPPPYGAPAPYGAPLPVGQGARNGLGITALVLGIVSILGSWFVLPVVGALLAIAFGIVGRTRAKNGQATNKGVATAGLVTGAVGLVASALFLWLWIALFTSPAGQRWFDCREAAGSDRAAQQVCTNDLMRDYFGVSDA